MFNRRLRHLLAGVLLAMVTGIAAEVPRPSPDLTIDLTDGKQVTLSQFKGKVCILAFILTTCPHCQKTVGYLSALQKEYGPQGLQVVASAVEDMAKMNVPDFIQRFQPPFPVGFSNLNTALGYLQHPAMFRLLMPQLVFIDRQGSIQAQYEGDDKFFAEDQEKHLREQVQMLLKETSKKHTTRTAKKAS